MKTQVVIMAAALSLPTAGTFAASEVQGRLTSDGCTGRSVIGHGWGEEIAYMSPLPVGTWGGGCTTLVNPMGWYSIQGTFPAGDYLMSTLSFDRAPAFALSKVTLPGGTGVVQNVEIRTPAHYSVAYNQAWTEWAAEPWIWGDNFYQTFTATSRHITRLATKLAGKSGDHYSMTLNFAIYRPNDGPPSTWQLMSPTRSYYFAGTVDPIIVIAWVPFRSSEVNMTVGEQYALRLWVAPGSQADSFALVVRTDRNDGYANGHLYKGDTARTDLDAYAYISGGMAGTVTNYAPATQIGLQQMASWSTRFGQKFQATGSGLAGVAAVYTTGQPDTISLPIHFQLYDEPGGLPIGPARRINGVHGFYQGRAMAAWEQGEVPLTPGQMYYLEWTPPPGGCNTWYMQENRAGEAYLDGVSKAPYDLMMAITEYAVDSPVIALSTTQIQQVAMQGDPPSTQLFSIRNAGSGTLNYQISENSDWLEVSPTEGSSTGLWDTITATFTPAGLLRGTHVAALTITDPQASNSPQVIAVSLIVKNYPGDMDNDTDVDLEDWGRFQNCLTDAGTAQTAPECDAAHLDADTDVDQTDVEVFLQCLGGPELSVPAGCPTGM